MNPGLIVLIVAVIVAVVLITRNKSSSSSNNPTTKPTGSTGATGVNSNPTPTPVPTPTGSTGSTGPVPIHWTLASSYTNVAALVADCAAHAFGMAVTVDGNTVWKGFGPAIQFWTQPNGTIGMTKPSTPAPTPTPKPVPSPTPTPTTHTTLFASYPNVAALVADAKSIKFGLGIEVDNVSVYSGFGPDAQYWTQSNGSVSTTKPSTPKPVPTPTPQPVPTPTPQPVPTPTPQPVPTPTPSPTTPPAAGATWNGSVWDLVTNSVLWQTSQVGSKSIGVAKITIPENVPANIAGKSFSITAVMTPNANWWSLTSTPNSWPTADNPDSELKTSSFKVVDGPMFRVQIGGVAGSGVVVLQPGHSYFINVINTSRFDQDFRVSVGAQLS